MSTLSSWRPLRALLTPIAAATLALAAQAQTLGTPVNVSNSAASSEFGRVAVVGANVYTVWTDKAANQRHLGRFARSADGGFSFSSPVTVLGSGTEGAGPHVAADGGYVYTARAAKPKKNKPTQVYFRASANNGMSFGPELQLTTASSGASLAAIAAAGSNAHVLWFTSVGPNSSVFVSSSSNGGATFAPPVDVSGAIGGGPGAMSALGANVHIAWAQPTGPTAEIYYSRSSNGGASFSAPVNLSNSPGQGSSFPQLALAGTNVYVAYREGPQVRLIRSLDGGASFGAPVNVSSLLDVHGLAGGPRLAASGSALHVIWNDDTVAQPANYDVFHRSSLDGGGSFGAVTNLGAIASVEVGLVAAEGLNAYVAWNEASGGSHIRQSVDGGATFAAAVTVSAFGGPAFIAAQPAPAGVHIGWGDSTLGNNELFYRFGSTP
ncbi:MAG TPA: hypothetical protein PLO41_11250 [Rubrivivax sp.]|nr:hypothetical protein [Rubrivivax sp.]